LAGFAPVTSLSILGLLLRCGGEELHTLESHLQSTARDRVGLLDGAMHV
jgi:hypothetical protein